MSRLLTEHLNENCLFCTVDFRVTSRNINTRVCTRNTPLLRFLVIRRSIQSVMYILCTIAENQGFTKGQTVVTSNKMLFQY